MDYIKYMSTPHPSQSPRQELPEDILETALVLANLKNSTPTQEKEPVKWI